MPTKHRPTQRPWRRHELPAVTPEMLGLWRRAKKLRKESDEYRAVEVELQGLIGMSKFGPTPFGGSALLAGGEVNEPLARRWREALERADREA